MEVTVSKTIRTPQPRRVRLTQTEGIDMAAALHDFIGMGVGTGRSQAERMKRYGRRAQLR